MNWLTSYVRPKIRSLVVSKEVPDNLWSKCPSCGRMVFNKEIEQNMEICPHCNHHFRINPSKRIEILMDEGYEKVEFIAPKEDPLEFSDVKKYSERIKEYRKKTERKEAVEVVSGTIDTNPVVLAVMDIGFMGGSMGSYVGEAIVQGALKAIEDNCSYIIVTASGGARMQEGIISLMQMARTTVAISKLKEKRLPFIVVLTDPTTGGVTASFAMLGDIHISEPGALIGFAGPRVIQETLREKLPEGFQRAEYLLDHGMVDIIADRREMKDLLARIIGMIGPSRKTSAISSKTRGCHSSTQPKKQVKKK